MWIKKILGSSVGKKLLMAITGLFFCTFIFAHLLGNLMIYGGKNAFNSYAAHLHSLGPILKLMELSMLLFATIHIFTGLWLFIKNKSARPIKYQYNKNAGGRTLGSATMPYTGIIILIFVIVHLSMFHFIDHTNQTIYDIVSNAFSNPITVFFYIFVMIILSIQIIHGFWSLFQTFGLNHEKYTPVIKIIGLLFSIFIGVGFGFIPIWILLFT